MEIKEITGIPLQIFTDEIFNVSYLRFLTTEKLKVIKLPTNIQNYKLRHLINSNHLLDVELVKTKKNWILKSINSHKKLCQLEEYNDYLKHSEITNLLIKYIKEEQHVDILEFLIHSFENKFESHTLAEFESLILSKLGFAGEHKQGSCINAHLKLAKFNSGLV